MSRQITVEHNGTTYYAEVMRATGTSLGTEDHGILTAHVHCEGHGTGISVGGYALDFYDAERKGRVPTGYGLDHIVQIARTIGVNQWEDIPGRDLLVLFDGAGSLGRQAVGIAHISDESRVLIFSEHAAEWRARNAEAVSA